VLIDRDEAWPALTAKIHDRISDLRRDLLALYNCIAELAACGLVPAEIRTRGQDTNARVDLDTLARIGMIDPEPTRRPQRLREPRRLLAHEYATATDEQVREASPDHHQRVHPVLRRLPRLDRSLF
jgi:hypothetical protein